MIVTGGERWAAIGTCAVMAYVLLPMTASSQVSDVTNRMERLGNPYKEEYSDGELVYARNIWDLQVFEGRVYLGGGNSSNMGPAINAGPVPIISYNPKTGQFKREFTVDDEQIDIYYVFDGRLYTPGHDPRESWELGNFYRLEANGEWKKHRTIPGAIHTYAMAADGGTLIAGLGSVRTVEDSDATRPCAGVATSSDQGATWKKTDLVGYRIHSFLTVRGSVYAMDVLIHPKHVSEWRSYFAGEDDAALYAAVHEFDGKDAFQPRPDLSTDVIFPGSELEGHELTRVVKPVAFGSKAVYIGGFRHNDHQFIPFGLFVASSLKNGGVDVRQIEVPTGTRPWDLMVRDDKVYVLLDSPAERGRSVRVMASAELNDWEEVLRFRASTFARSFETLDGYFYFGLGCTIADPGNWTADELASDAGETLRVKVAQ